MTTLEKKPPTRVVVRARSKPMLNARCDEAHDKFGYVEDGVASYTTNEQNGAENWSQKMKLPEG